MADYYPLIARAIAGLDPSAPGESRRALYERARTALIAQLRSVQPPLSESEITRERLSLEEAVRKVESEAAQRAREASRPGGGSGAPRGGDAFRRANARPPETAALRAAARSARAASAVSPRPAMPVRRSARRTSAAAQSARRCAAARRAASAAAADSDAGCRLPPPPPRERRAAPAAAPTTARRRCRRRPACAASATSPPTPMISAAPPRRPTVPRERPMPTCRRPRRNSTGSSRAWKTAAAIRRPYSYDESLEEADRYAPQPPQPPPRERSRLSQDRDREPKKQRARSGAVFPFKSAIAVGIVLILVGAGILWGKSAVTAVGGLFKSSPVAEAQKDPAAPQARPKIPDRVGQPSSSENVAPVAQRVVLYDEDPSDPKGKQYVGSVVWRTEPIKASGNQKPDIAVRADIEIPDRKFKMTMSFRRNTDSSLPASHTAELTFILPQDFSGGGVGNVPGILMKSNEQARGTPLAGLAVKVTDGFFLVGLSNVDSDRARNLQLLKERSWFDVPLVYVNQRRAIIAIEKGAPGERAFNDAFAAWGE